MGDCSTNVRKLKTVREQNNTLEITVAFWLNWSLNATEINYDLRMTLRMWWNHKWPFGFPYLPSFKLDCMAIIPNNEDNRILQWTWFQMCKTNFQPWKSAKISVKKTYSVNMWILFDTVRGIVILRRSTKSNFGTKFWCYLRQERLAWCHSVMEIFLCKPYSNATVEQFFSQLKLIEAKFEKTKHDSENQIVRNSTNNISWSICQQDRHILVQSLR